MGSLLGIDKDLFELGEELEAYSRESRKGYSRKLNKRLIKVFDEIISEEENKKERIKDIEIYIKELIDDIENLSRLRRVYEDKDEELKKIISKMKWVREKIHRSPRNLLEGNRLWMLSESRKYPMSEFIEETSESIKELEEKQKKIDEEMKDKDSKIIRLSRKLLAKTG